MKRSYLAALLVSMASFAAIAADAPPPSVEPFAVNSKFGPKPVKAQAANANALKVFGANAASSWIVAGVPLAPGVSPFAVEQQGGKAVIRISVKKLAVGQTLVAARVPEDQIKPAYNYIAITCKSLNGPVPMTIGLASSTAAEAPTFKTTATVQPGEWQKLILPLAQFGMKGVVKMVGFGVDAADTDEADVLVSDITLGTAPLTADYLKAQRTQISLTGYWHFATDDGERGVSEKWFAPEFDDSKWQPLKSAMAWNDQGVTHAGWGWYRQKITIPKESAGVPLTIYLGDTAYEDDCYFNGQHIGGLVGNYKYSNLLPRAYTVPAELVKAGAENKIAVRVWGTPGNTFGSSKNGLSAGLDPKNNTYYVAELDPFAVRLRKAGASEEVGPDHFDITDAQHGAPFDVIFHLPADVLKKGNVTLRYAINDYYGQTIKSGDVPVAAGKNGVAEAVVNIDAAAAKVAYLRGRMKAFLAVCDPAGVPVCVDMREIDRLSFEKRDNLPLPALADKTDDTPYGQLKLIDDIDCSQPVDQDPHPYLQGAFDHRQDRMTPGAPLDVNIEQILGKPARVTGNGFFAYRIGRGKLSVHHTYLLRVEYPEDKPRYAPMEIQCGHSFMDIGWKNGLSPTDPYDNWPTSGKWETYDAIFPLDEETIGTSGSGGASAEHGVWVYFMDKRKPGRFVDLYGGGPAIGHMRLYEIDAIANAPKINKPAGLPQRTLMFDWERQADQPAGDLVQYAKLMGYNAISPIMLKWAFANYGDPLSGYKTTILDGHRYWTMLAPDDDDDTKPVTETDDNNAPAAPETTDAKDAAPAKPVTDQAGKRPSQHREYLAATKKYGVNYIPRIEYGGSNDLPIDARAIGSDGETAKPNRFAKWGADLLAPATWDDLSRTVDAYFKPFAADNPQLTGMLWRIRSDRMQTSYGGGDVELFSKETGTAVPPKMTNRQLAQWASNGPVAEQYATWWHQKREQFHAKLVALLQSYRPDMVCYYFNWDSDKIALGLRDMNTASTFADMAKAQDGVAAVYARHVAAQKVFAPDDYVTMIRTGQLTPWPGQGREYGVRTELYKDLKGFRLFAPANSLYLADNAKYLNYFQGADGLSVSNTVSYDEMASRSINPKFEGNMISPAGANFSMALELLSYFHGDATTLTYTAYTYGRGFADAHRRFAQAFLALPAVEGKVVEGTSDDVKIRTYSTPQGTYVGVAYKGYKSGKITVKLPVSGSVTDLVTGQPINASNDGGQITFDVNAQPMELGAYLVK